MASSAMPATPQMPVRTLGAAPGAPRKKVAKVPRTVWPAADDKDDDSNCKRLDMEFEATEGKKPKAGVKRKDQAFKAKQAKEEKKAKKEPTARKKAEEGDEDYKQTKAKKKVSKQKGAQRKKERQLKEDLAFEKRNPAGWFDLSQGVTV